MHRCFLAGLLVVALACALHTDAAALSTSQSAVAAVRRSEGALQVDGPIPYRDFSDMIMLAFGAPPGECPSAEEGTGDLPGGHFCPPNKPDQSIDIQVTGPGAADIQLKWGAFGLNGKIVCDSGGLCIVTAYPPGDVLHLLGLECTAFQGAEPGAPIVFGCGWPGGHTNGKIYQDPDGDICIAFLNADGTEYDDPNCQPADFWPPGLEAVVRALVPRLFEPIDPTPTPTPTPDDCGRRSGGLRSAHTSMPCRAQADDQAVEQASVQ